MVALRSSWRPAGQSFRSKRKITECRRGAQESSLRMDGWSIVHTGWSSGLDKLSCQTGRNAVCFVLGKRRRCTVSRKWFHRCQNANQGPTPGPGRRSHCSHLWDDFPCNSQHQDEVVHCQWSGDSADCGLLLCSAELAAGWKLQTFGSLMPFRGRPLAQTQHSMCKCWRRVSREGLLHTALRIMLLPMLGWSSVSWAVCSVFYGDLKSLQCRGKIHNWYRVKSQISTVTSSLSSSLSASCCQFSCVTLFI